MEKYKVEERKAILALLYNQGADQFSKEAKETETYKKYKEFKEFRKIIDREAKKRKYDDPYKLTDYFAGHKEELLNLLKKKDTKKLVSKFKKIYSHSEMHNLISKLATGKRFKKEGIKTVDIPTIGEEPIKGEVMVWTNKGIEYFVKADDLIKFNGKSPKVYVGQIKNISLIMALIQEQQFNNSIKEAKCEFTLSYYAIRRGHTKEEVKRSGNFFNELKRDLYTGAYTTYRIDKVMIDGKEYIAHGIPNFYTLYEPKDYENKWKLNLNNPYSGWSEEILSGKASKYFITDPKAIEDRTTDNRPYLFLFYMQLRKRRLLHKLHTFPVEIKDLLNDMQLSKEILKRPKRCFTVLKECLIYFNEHYQPVPELESFVIYNNFHKEKKTIKLPLSISEAFKKYDYADFKSLLIARGIKDIRGAYISFKRPYSKPKAKVKPCKEDIELRNNILEWAEEWEVSRKYSIEKTEEERRKFVDDRIRYMGRETVRDLFEQEINKEKPHAYNFLIYILANKENWEDIDWDNY